MVSHSLGLLLQIIFDEVVWVESFRDLCSNGHSRKGPSSNLTSSPACSMIRLFSWEGTTESRNDSTCTERWQKRQDGGCLWIPGENPCQPNCVDSRNNLAENECADHQFCQWVIEIGCRYNIANENNVMKRDQSGTTHSFFGATTTPRNVREYYCNAEYWSNNPTAESPATPINNYGQVMFCYGVSPGHSRYQDFHPVRLHTASESEYEKICPKVDKLQHLLPDPKYFVNEIEEGGSSAAVWGVMCKERGKSKIGTCKYILKALTLKEASVTQRMLKEQATNPLDSLLMPVCAWWIPGQPPFFNLDQNLTASFSSLSSNYIKQESAGGRVWILMPNIGHADFLPGVSAGKPIDVKGWYATSAKYYGALVPRVGARINESDLRENEFTQNGSLKISNESEFRHQYTRNKMTFVENAPENRWHEKLVESLAQLAANKVSDYSLLFAISRISVPALSAGTGTLESAKRLCTNEYSWPHLLVATWMPDKEKNTLEWLCVAMSLIDFTKKEDDFGWRDNKQRDAIEYAKNMLGIFVDEQESKRLVRLSENLVESLADVGETLPKLSGGTDSLPKVTDNAFNGYGLWNRLWG